jgi:hypothetical protein
LPAKPKSWKETANEVINNDYIRAIEQSAQNVQIHREQVERKYFVNSAKSNTVKISGIGYLVCNE